MPFVISPKNFMELTKRTFVSFGDANPFNWAAIIAYYTVFSLPAILLMIIKLSGFFLSEQAATGELFNSLSGIMGQEAAADIQELVSRTAGEDGGGIAAIIGVATVAFSATTVFIALQNSLNTIWEVKAKPERGWLKFIVNRLLSFGVVATGAFLLLVSLAADAVINVLSRYMDRMLGELSVVLAWVINTTLNLSLITFLFALIYKFLPDATIKWRTVWIGAFVTTLLFVAGKFGISFFITHSDQSSSYGAAGSIILVLVWVYYSAMILLLGAEFTQTYAEMSGEPIVPADHAVKLDMREIEVDHKDPEDPNNPIRPDRVRIPEPGFHQQPAR